MINDLESTARIRILGIGNTLYQDEGVGMMSLPYLEEIFKDDSDVEVMDGSTDGMRLLGPVEESEYLIILDAINAGKEGGTIITLQGDEIPAYYGIKMSIHQLGFQEVLLAAKIRDKYPKHIVMMGMQPTSLELGIGLSPANEEQLPKLIELVKNQVSEWKKTL
ncbi:HyaD/HybD family hydrogenase maturation endopeptidase [Bacillus massiliigorillae]|uniref:HyaD/HybD family hydrogenase maturation endopeptidase n=1 Tax=Bacillus massiliigorillae TaxID=1243664 RepID=UPI0003A335DC|nr:HyaD/HybD family hydrogenase maturation endopeptidase [Bacillus massiliigorillae]